MDARRNPVEAGTDERSPIDTMRGDLPGQDTLSDYEEELPVYLSLLKDLPSTSPYDLPEDQLRHIPAGNNESGWQNCLNSVEKFDRELCQAYREQIDTLLVFAGLFSAVVTAFAVESYQWLQDDPLDTSVELLRDMVVLLSQSSNVTAPPSSITSPRISGSAVARINCFWFLSLSLSLSAALVGILCKQWLREFERNVGQSPDTALAVRYVRFQGFESWKVGSIVMSVPIIMQVALALFMIGIIDLLWRLHVVVACCVTVVAVLTLVFFLTTTFLPVMQYAYICARCSIEPLQARTYAIKHAFTEPQCAFKSAQAWLAFRIAQPIIDHFLKLYGYRFSFRHPPHDVHLGLRRADSWVTFDLNWVKRHDHLHLEPRCAFKSLAWIAENLGENDLSASIWHCVWARWVRNSGSRETVAMATLAIETVARSYRGVIPLGYIEPPRIRAQGLMFQCSLRTDLPIETAVELFVRVAPVVGVDSRWTREAVRAILVAHQHHSIHITDGLSVHLFRLAELQANTIVFRIHNPGNPASQLNAALAFTDILALIHRGSSLRSPLLAAMSGLALQLIRAHPPAHITFLPRLVFQHTIRYFTTLASHGNDVQQLPGAILVAKLASAVDELWPEYVRARYFDDLPPDHPPILPNLLAMLTNGAPRGVDQTFPGPHFMGEENANAPIPSDTDGDHDAVPERTEPPDLLSRSAGAGESQPAQQPHMGVSVHGDTKKDANCPPSSAGAPATLPPRASSPVRASSLSGSPVTLESPV